jgi:leader peptidase (prepilin peptidase)/N-methyltransferase
VVLGAVSWPAVVLGAVLASVLTLVGATVAQMIGRRAVHGLPHGPSMLVAAWLVLIVAAAGATVTGAPT